MRERMCNLDLKTHSGLLGFFDKLGKKNVLKRESHEKAGE